MTLVGYICLRSGVRVLFYGALIYAVLLVGLVEVAGPGWWALAGGVCLFMLETFVLRKMDHPCQCLDRAKMSDVIHALKRLGYHKCGQTIDTLVFKRRESFFEWTFSKVVVKQYHIELQVPVDEEEHFRSMCK